MARALELETNCWYLWDMGELLMPRWPLSWSRNSRDVCRNGQMPRSRVSSMVFGWCVLIRLLAQNWLEIQSQNPVPEVVSFHDLIQSEVEKSILPESRDQSKVVRGYQQWRIGDKLCGQRMLPSMSAVKGCCSHQPLQSPSDGTPPPLPRGFRMEKKRILALHS